MLMGKWARGITFQHSLHDAFFSFRIMFNCHSRGKFENVFAPRVSRQVGFDSAPLASQWIYFGTVGSA